MSNNQVHFVEASDEPASTKYFQRHSPYVATKDEAWDYVARYIQADVKDGHRLDYRVRTISVEETWDYMLG